MLLVHGGSVHRGWWSATAPQLQRRFDLLIPDLSGHGHSDHRATYSPISWSADLAALIEYAQLHNANLRPMTIVGHSMGGRVGIYLASRWPQLVAHLILIDTPLQKPSATDETPRGRPRTATRVYASRDEALNHFRLRPPETVAHVDLLAKVAKYGLREVESGWTWRFDPEAGQRFTDSELQRELRRLSCPVGFVYGQMSTMVGPSTIQYLTAQIGRHVPTIVVPNAYHHVPLDNPDGCADAIENMHDLLATSVLSH